MSIKTAKKNYKITKITSIDKIVKNMIFVPDVRTIVRGRKENVENQHSLLLLYDF
jgi:hypothetical protein